MLQTSILPTNHQDLITDIAYDFYGERLATASADQRIKIFQRASSIHHNDADTTAPPSSSSSSGWILQDEFRAHTSPVLKLSWSHPEFGSLIASCGYDRTVRIWEEVKVANTAATTSAGGGNSGTGGATSGSQGGGSGVQQAIGMNQAARDGAPTRRWIERGLLTDAKGSVRCVEFGPSAFGLKLASISTDSYLRIHTSLQPTPTDWQLTSQASLPALTLPGASAAETTQQQPAVDQPPPSLLGAGPSSSLSAPQAGAPAGSSGATPSGGPGKGNEALGGWSLSWCKEKWWGQVLAVTSGHSGIIKIVSVSGTRPVALAILSPPPPPPTPSNANGGGGGGGGTSGSTAAYGLGAQAIASLSWAPSCGRSYHLIASGSRDGTVRVWKVRGPGMGLNQPEAAAAAEQVNGRKQSQTAADKAWKAEIAGEWGRGDAAVGRVEWNVTGSVLSVASEDGKVRLYKATFAGAWDCLGEFSAEAPPDVGAEDEDMIRE